MKSYLSLISISAKVHRRQNFMTLLCIVFSVFMVTAVFSMAEAGARMEQARLIEKHGSLSFRELFSSTMGQTLLTVAGILFLLILLAGVLMISSSINNSVSQRTKFFGMMRCIGMSKQQVRRFVRLEALSWCKIAVPVGLGLGLFISWGLCAALRFLVEEEFSQIPLFHISILGIASGILVGVVTVLIAASSPAKRAAKVSPVTAASGNAENIQSLYHSVKLPFFRIETALGFHHATSAKKNLILMTGSFALSIILFLNFSVVLDFVNYLMPQSASTPDIEIFSRDGSNSIDCGIEDAMNEIEGIRQVYGRRNYSDIPVGIGRDTALSIKADLISFDSFELDGLKKDHILKSGSDLKKIYGDSHYVLATCDQDSLWEKGDKIIIDGEELEIAGLLKYDPFSSDGLTHGKPTLIVSGETFTRLTGISNYSLVMLQTAPDITDENVQLIQNCVDEQYQFRDRRGESTAGTYLAFMTCVYSFVIIITLVALLNIVNSIAMSVSGKIKQYGAMRAIGMDGHQMTKMILAEAFSYAFWGCIAGCMVGLPLSKLLYDFLITKHFPYATWSLPVSSLLIIFFFIVFAAAVAAYLPARRITNIPVTEIINEL